MMSGPVQFRLIGFALLLGAIVNVAVAWACAMWAPIPLSPSAIGIRLVNADESSRWRANVPSHISSKPLITSFHSGSTIALIYVSSGRTGQIDVSSDESGRITGIELPPMPQPVFSDHALFVQSGWPYKSMQGSRWISGNGQRGQMSLAAIMGIAPVSGSETLVHALRFDRKRSSSVEYRIIPVQPEWIGFSLNTLLYGVIMLLFFLSVAKWRCRNRRWRGQCPACAYPVGTSPVCTECGQLVSGNRSNLAHACSQQNA